MKLRKSSSSVHDQHDDIAKGVPGKTSRSEQRYAGVVQQKAEGGESAGPTSVNDVAGQSDPAPLSGAGVVVQARAADDAGSVGSRRAGAVHREAMQGIGGTGTALPHQTKMESYFGGPLNVSAHTGARAQAASEGLGAKAYTVGRDIAFASNNPSQETVAHELTHVAQQAQGVRLDDGLGRTGDAYERQADAVAAGVRSGRPAADFLGGSFPARSGGAPLAIQREEDSTQVVRESVVGSRTSGETEQTRSRGDATVTTEHSHKRMLGARSAVERIVETDDDTIERAVQVLALAGAFGETASKVVLQSGRLTLAASGEAKGRVGTTASAKVGRQTVEREVIVDGETRVVIDSLKLLAEAGIEVGAGANLEGKLEAAYGLLGVELEGKLDTFAGMAGAVGGSVSASKVDLTLKATVGADFKIGVEVAPSGSLKVKVGPYVALEMAVGFEFFAGAKMSTSASASLDLRSFFSLGISHQPESWEGGDDPTYESTKESGDDGGDTSVSQGHGLDLEAKFEAMAGATGQQTGELRLKLGDFALMDLSEEVNALAGAEAGAEAKFGMSLHEITASAKAEAFAGLKAKAEGSVAPITYKGRALFKFSGGAEVSLGVGASAEAEFTIGFGKIHFSGAAAATLGFGFGFEVGVDIDLTVIVEMIKDLVVFALAQAAKPDQQRAQRGLRVGRFFATGQPETPDDADEPAVENKIRKVYTDPFRLYESKKARQGKHGIKKDEIQKLVDDGAFADPALPTMLPTKAADRSLKKVAEEVFGTTGVLTAITFQAGIIKTFTTDEGAVTRQKKIRGSARSKLQKYKNKKRWFGAHGAKANQVKLILNLLLIDLLAETPRPPEAVLKHELQTAATEIFGERISMTFGTGTSLRVETVDMHTEKTEPTERDTDHAALRTSSKETVRNDFKKLNDKKLKKRKGWVTRADVNKLVGTKRLAKMLEIGVQASPRNDQILAGIQEAAEEVFGLGAGKVTFRVFLGRVNTATFPRDRDVNTEKPAAYLRYAREQVAARVTAQFAAYAQKKAGKGAHWIKKDKLQKAIDRAKVKEFLVGPNEIAAVKEIVTEKALAAFGAEHVFTLEVVGSGKNQKLNLKELQYADNMLHGDTRYNEAKESIQAKAKNAVLSSFTGYAAKKSSQGKHWIKKEQIQAIVDKSKVAKFIPAGANDEITRDYKAAIVAGLGLAALEAFGTRAKLLFEVAGDGLAITVKQLQTVAVPVGTTALDPTQRAAIGDTEAKARAAVTPKFEQYAARSKQARGALKRWSQGDATGKLDVEQLQKLVEKSNVSKFLDPAAPSNKASPINVAVLKGVREAAEGAFGSRQTFLVDLLGEEVWMKRVTSTRDATDPNIAAAKRETTELAKAAVKTRFEQYVDKKTKVKNWHSVSGFQFGIRSRHWIKKGQIDKRIVQADLTRYMDPYNKRRSLPLNDAVLDGVKQAADEAFPSDLVTMTFKLATPSVDVNTFAIQDKAIKLKVGSQLHYAFSKYRDSRGYKKLIKKGGAASFTAIKTQLKKIVDDRVASDYRTGDAWKTTVDEVGKFVFTDTTWLSIKPV